MTAAPVGRVCYFCPDFPQPSGGVRTIYRHVHVLRNAGVDAVVVHQKSDFVARWHTYEAPVIWLENRPQFGQDDTLVFPEVMGEMVRSTRGFRGRRYLFALSWLPSYTSLKPGERWRDLGVDGIMAQSETVAQALAWSEGRRPHLIPPFVDPALYHLPGADHDDAWPATAGQTMLPRRSIVYLTRKNRAGEWLHGLLAERAASAGLFWEPLRQLDEATYAARLRQASLYVPTTVQEGLHVSVLEAMACGVLVVGFAAVGGTDYMIASGPGQNCVMVANGDLPALAQRLDEVLAAVAGDDTAFATVRTNAQATARRFQDPAAQRNALIALFGAR